MVYMWMITALTQRTQWNNRLKQEGRREVKDREKGGVMQNVRRKGTEKGSMF